MCRVTASAPVATVSRLHSLSWYSPHNYQDTSNFDGVVPHKLIPYLAVDPHMPTSLAALSTSLPLQAGLLGTQMGQLLVALILVAVVIIVGKFVLKLAWRLITIGIVVVAVLFLLSTVGVI